VREVIGGGAIALVPPAIALGSSGRGQGFHGSNRRLHLGADAHDLGGAGWDERARIETTGVGRDGLSQRIKLLAHGIRSDRISRADGTWDYRAG
jgi:hypothetical protein